MASFEEQVINQRRNIEDALRNKQMKRLATLANLNLNWAIQFRNVYTEQTQRIDDLKKDGVKLAANKADQEEKHNIECNANAVFLQFQLDAVRKEAIAQISYLTRQNRMLNLEIKRLKSENANNSQETSN
jgi:hypothetical protein